jgi:lysine-ketoglutarate reductase/saccharopine dehydrogenase-like protein (TIGR00300 family)
MDFILPQYNEPNLLKDPFASSPNAKTSPVLKDGVAPRNYHATSNFPEYFKISNKWVLAAESRMDCVVVAKSDDRLEIKELRRLREGEQVIVGRKIDGSEGIYVFAHGFTEEKAERDIFSFRNGRSRETSYSKDYDKLYGLLRHEKEDGYIVWVLGPAVVFDRDSRTAMVSLVKNGFVDAILAGNALATHDLEGSIYKTALGQNIYNQNSITEGHYHHMEVINTAREYNTLEEFVKNEHINDGIVHACIENNIPFVLTGSIRDDGPLPEVISDVYVAQDKMREHMKKATTVIGMATMLHTIATCNMTPSYQVINGTVRPVYIYSVDVSEFAVNKLKDRGTIAVTTIVANVQDFVVHIERNLVQM